MTILITKRQFLKGLFATPAIVAASSLMPISTTQNQAFKLESFTEIPSYMHWNLVREKGGNYAWMKNSDIQSFIKDIDVIKEIRMSEVGLYDFKGNQKLTVELMKMHSCQVIHELPLGFKKSLII